MSSRIKKILKWFGIGLLSFFLFTIGFVFWKFYNIERDLDRIRCKDLSKGIEIVASIDSLIDLGIACTSSTIFNKVKIESMELPNWEYNPDIEKNTYSIHCQTAAAFPIWIGVRLSYYSDVKKWEFLCDGDRWEPDCN